MKLLFDTSSLIAAFVESHPAHPAAWEWLEQTLEGRTASKLRLSCSFWATVSRKASSTYPTSPGREA